MKPFFPDNHFQDHVEIRHASKETTQWLKAILLDSYKELDINNDTHIDEISGSNINSGNYRIGNFYIKTIKHNNDKENVLEFPTIVKQLTERNIPSASYIPNNQGQLIYDYYCELFSSNFYISVQTFISSDFYSGAPQEFESALSLVRKLEESPLTLDHSKSKSPYLDWNPSKVLIDTDALLSKKKELSEFDTNIMEMLPKVTSIITDFQDYIVKLSSPSMYYGHYDLHPHNLLFKQHELVSLIDLESFVNIHSEVTSSFALFKLGRKSLSKEFLNLTEFKIKSSDHGFELKKLFPYVQIELVRRFVLIIDLHYFKNNSEWNDDIFKHYTGLKEAELLFL